MELLNPLALTLIHFLWQGSVVALCAALALAILRHHDARIRYAVACGALLIMALLPGLTFLSRLDAGGDAPLPLPALAVNAGASADRVLPVLAVLWMVGVLVATIRHARAWFEIRDWVATAERPAANVEARFVALARKLGLRGSLRIAISRHVDVPTALGWLRPVILIPASSLTGLPAAQLDAILAHELAHIRRHDSLVNLIQLVVETLLFYHPGVWWISRQIRIERENCCDDLAVAICGDQRTYLEALTRLESLRASTPSLTLSAGGGSLVSRVRRLLTQGPSRGSGPAVLVAVGLLLLSLTAGIYACENPTKSPGASEDAAEAANLAFGEAATDAEENRFLVRVDLGDGESVQEFVVDELHTDGEGNTWFELKDGQALEWTSADGEPVTLTADRIEFHEGDASTLPSEEENRARLELHHQKLLDELVERGTITAEERQLLDGMHRGNGLDTISPERLEEIKRVVHGVMGMGVMTHEEAPHPEP